MSGEELGNQLKLKKKHSKVIRKQNKLIFDKHQSKPSIRLFTGPTKLLRCREGGGGWFLRGAQSHPHRQLSQFPGGNETSPKEMGRLFSKSIRFHVSLVRRMEDLRTGGGTKREKVGMGKRRPKRKL